MVPVLVPMTVATIRWQQHTKSNQLEAAPTRNRAGSYQQAGGDDAQPTIR